MFSIEFSQKSLEDISSIFDYTLLKFGKVQMLKYQKLVDENLLLIAKSPNLGHFRPDIPVNYFAWPVGQHSFIYRIEIEVIFILRVLHKNMDFRHQF